MSGVPKINQHIPREKTKDRAWLTRTPYFLGAILFHLILLLLLATWVIFPALKVEPDPTTFQTVKISRPPPPPTPAASGGEARNALEPDLQVTPPPISLAAVVTTQPSSFQVAAVKVAQPNLPSVTRAKSTGLENSGVQGSQSGPGSALGSKTGSEDEFVGNFYDLKQTPDHKPTNMTTEREIALLADFFKKGWNEDDWATRFLKSPAPLYANELLVPLMTSSEGPKAYGLDKICQPGYWCTIYHLNVSPTRSGTFRVAGYGDDFLVVRVDGKIVLDSGWFSPVTNFTRKTIYPAKWLKELSPGRPDYGQTVVGAPFEINSGKNLSIDVLMGDVAAAGGMGRCGYFLFLLEDGKAYDKDAQGNPLLPVLQIHPNTNLNRPGERPPFTTQPENALSN